MEDSSQLACPASTAVPQKRRKNIFYLFVGSYFDVKRIAKSLFFNHINPAADLDREYKVAEKTIMGPIQSTAGTCNTDVCSHKFGTHFISQLFPSVTYTEAH